MWTGKLSYMAAALVTAHIMLSGPVSPAVAGDIVLAQATGTETRSQRKQRFSDQLAALRALGFDAGRSPGNRRARPAIISFQQKRGWPGTGVLSPVEEATLFKLAAKRGFAHPGYSDAVVRQIQEALGKVGFSLGEPDGFWGGQSMTAARAYQKSIGHEQTAVLTEAEIKGLFVESIQAVKTTAPSDEAQSVVTDGTPSIEGIWKGRYQCLNGHYEILAEVTVKRVTSDRIAAVFTFKSYRGQRAIGAFAMVGDYQSGQGYFELKPKHWLKRPSGDWSMVSVIGRYVGDKDRISAQVQGCSELGLIRTAALEIGPGAADMLGLDLATIAVAKGATIMRGSVTETSVIFDISGTEYLNELREDCHRNSGSCRTSDIDAGFQSYLGGKSFNLTTLDASTPRVDWVKAPAIARSQYVGEGQYRFDIDRRKLGSGVCLAIQRMAINRRSADVFPIRAAADHKAFTFAMIEPLDEVGHQNAIYRVRDLKAEIARLEKRIPRDQAALETMATRAGAECVAPPEPTLPAPPTLPSRQLVGQLANGLCYEVLQTRHNPQSAYGAIKGAFWDQVLNDHRQWKTGALKTLSCASATNLDLGDAIADMLARAFAGGVAELEALQLRFSNCTGRIESRCLGDPMTAYRKRVSRMGSFPVWGRIVR